MSRAALMAATLVLATASFAQTASTSLGWDPVKDGAPADGYRLYWHTSPDVSPTNFTGKSADLPEADVCSDTDADGELDTCEATVEHTKHDVLWWVATAFNDAGEGPPSNVVRAEYVAPAAPGGVKVKVIVEVTVGGQ